MNFVCKQYSPLLLIRHDQYHEILRVSITNLYILLTLLKPPIPPYHLTISRQNGEKMDLDADAIARPIDMSICIDRPYDLAVCKVCCIGLPFEWVHTSLGIPFMSLVNVSLMISTSLKL